MALAKLNMIELLIFIVFQVMLRPRSVGAQHRNGIRMIDIHKHR
jgi:hypothetical protein